MLTGKGLNFVSCYYLIFKSVVDDQFPNYCDFFNIKKYLYFIGILLINLHHKVEARKCGDFSKIAES